MTAEVAILNKSAAALAADSAVTTGYTGREKVFTSANKIFMLSKHAPVGVMIYGHVDHCLVPWETIIKDIRSKLGHTRFKHINGYADRMKEYISEPFYLKKEAQNLTVLAACISAYYMLEITLMEKELEKSPENIDLVFDTMGEIVDTFDILDNLSEHTKGEFVTLYGDIITEYFAKKEIFEAELPDEKHDRFCDLVFESLKRDMPSRFATGIVVSGFGEDEMFPTLNTFQVDGVIFDKCRILAGETVDIDRENNTVFVRAFAQDDVVNSFLDGVDDKYRKNLFAILHSYMREFMNEILDDHTAYDEDHKIVVRATVERNLPESLDEIRDAMLDFCKDEYRSPVEEVLRVAPKDELAHVAESLVSLTALKRRVAGEIESVGGPIDVAVISKGDGFVWIKRKHYFDPKLNHHFFENYFKKEGDTDVA